MIAETGRRHSMRAGARRLALALLAPVLLVSPSAAQMPPPPSIEHQATDSGAPSTTAPEDASVERDAVEALAAVVPSLFVEAAPDADDAESLAPAEFSLAGTGADETDDAALAGSVRSAAASGEPGLPGGPQFDVPTWLLVFQAAMVRAPVAGLPRAEQAALLEDALASDDLPAPRDPLAFRGSATVTDTETGDLRLLLAKGEQWHVLRAGAVATSRPLDARVTAYGQVAYMSSVAPAPRPAAVPAESDDSAEPSALGFKAEIDRFEVGAEYRALGRRLERVVPTPQARRDQEGSEVWLARRFGIVRLRVSRSELSDNVDRNPALPRTTKAQTAALAELSPHGWPVLGVTYATGDSERIWLTPTGRSRGVERQAFDSVAASVYYDGARWQASASTTYASSADRERPERETASVYQELAAGLRLAPAVAVTGTATIGQEQDRASAVRSEVYSAFLTLTYAPPDARWHAWTLAGHTSRRSSDGAVDGRSVSVGGGLGRDLGNLFSGRARLSLEAGYDQYEDRVAPSGSSQAIYGFLRLTFPAF